MNLDKSLLSDLKPSTYMQGNQEITWCIYINVTSYIAFEFEPDYRKLPRFKWSNKMSLCRLFRYFIFYIHLPGQYLSSPERAMDR